MDLAETPPPPKEKRDFFVFSKSSLTLLLSSSSDYLEEMFQKENDNDKESICDFHFGYTTYIHNAQCAQESLDFLSFFF